MAEFEEVLARLADKDRWMTNRPSSSPASAHARLSNPAFEAINAAKQPISWFGFETQNAYPVAEHTPQQPTEKSLKRAFAKAKSKIAQARRSDLATLKKIRAAYANDFHPDRLPEGLKRLANSQLAEINACLDAAKAASTI